MIVDRIYGTNTAGDIVGPSGTSVIFPLDLDEVSTIVPNISATHQLTLNDLHTDCPQTEEASVIATKVPGGPCDPILAAPKKVKSWASPCGACQNFGLFDPPYAVAPLTGGLVPMTTTTLEPAPQTTTTIAPATETTTPDETTASTISQSTATGVAVTLTESSGSFVATIPVTIPTSSDQLASESSVAAETATEPSMQTSTASTTSLASSSSSSSMGASPSSSIPAAPAAATRLSGGLGWIISLFLGIYFL
ncbi:hypothetical protein N7481_013118 [Penicillium waksmanii]|uniref:uncharacterized protein n=1 Tax=Penicillium waksmanii TaxID=69791 RepID=UPI002546A53F|nr:uncharacterized protein N7481_013118 [Penicillium waksmanii]KAJ5966404.1 hypothetical protein N7481_013118 [Penicillium waksmanii]